MKSRKTQNYGSFNQNPRSTFHDKLDLCTIMIRRRYKVGHIGIQASVGYMSDLYVCGLYMYVEGGGVNSQG